jgi:hypothetical protein
LVAASAAPQPGGRASAGPQEQITEVAEQVGALVGNALEARRQEQERADARRAAERQRRDEMIAQAPSGRIPSIGARLIRAEVYGLPERGDTVWARAGHRFTSQHWSLQGVRLTYGMSNGTGGNLRLTCLLLDQHRTVLQEFPLEWEAAGGGTRAKFQERIVDPSGGWQEMAYSLDCSLSCTGARSSK